MQQFGGTIVCEMPHYDFSFKREIIWDEFCSILHMPDRPSKILVVDDEDDIRNIISILLESEGYAVDTGPTGALLQNIDANDTQLVILDINLQYEDGRDLCRWIKQQKRAESIPVILISAIPELRSIYKECGASDYLSKPFDIGDLLKKVDRHVSAS